MDPIDTISKQFASSRELLSRLLLQRDDLAGAMNRIDTEIAQVRSDLEAMDKVAGLFKAQSAQEKSEPST